jgi:DNA helicase-2/ATP-dependent DNA helicase PcrA
MSTHILDNLNDAQRQAVTHPGGPLLILAGAGSGKTRALTYRAAYLMSEQGIPPGRILLTTFTNKAAQEMQARLERLTGERLPYAGTFHSLCARMLRRHGPEIGIERDFLIYDEDDQLSLLKTILKYLNLDPKESRPKMLMHTIEQAKQELLTPQEYAEYARGPLQKTAARVYETYELRLKEYHALDFNDLLMKTVQLFRQAEQVRDYYQNRFLHVLVDEYQDTNKAQYLLTKLLGGKYRNICVVGDASQAIYSWRGADYRNLLLLEEDFPDLTVIKLEQNYRSTQNILDAAYGVIAYNTLHPVLSLWTNADRGAGIHLFQAQDEYAESQFVLQTIQTQRSNDPKLKLKDHVILYRTNAQSRVLEEIFIRAGVPYILVGGVKFYERKEVKDVLAYLRLCQNSKDAVSRERLLKLGKRQLVTFEHWLSTKTRRLQKPFTLLNQILSVTSYLDRYDKDIPEDAARIENVQELLSVAQHFHDLSSFLENVALVEQDTKRAGWVTPSAAIELAGDEDAVIFMTLHASKGLEFNTVFMIGLEEGLFPHSRSLLAKPDLEEERRLCYVGITRAKRELYLTYAQNRLIYGNRSQNTPSRFLSEIPTKIIDSLSPGIAKNGAPAPVDDVLLEKFLKDEISIDEFLKS